MSIRYFYGRGDMCLVKTDTVTSFIAIVGEKSDICALAKNATL